MFKVYYLVLVISIGIEVDTIEALVLVFVANTRLVCVYDYRSHRQYAKVLFFTLV